MVDCPNDEYSCPKMPRVQFSVSTVGNLAIDCLDNKNNIFNT